MWTSGGIDKLELYARLGVGEVWLDVELLASFLDRPTALQAVRAFREALRK